MAKVISWQLNDTYIYLSGSTIAPQGAVIGANGTVISTEPQSENFISSLSEKWRLSENDSLSVYSDAFSGMLRDIQTLSGATYKVFGEAKKYFNVLAKNGVIALVGKDGKNIYNSGTSFYNIHILNQNIAIGLGGDMILDTAVTLETELYIEKDGIIRNDAITNVSAVLKKNDGTEVPVSIVTALTNSTVLVQLTVSGGTDFSEFEGQVAKYQIIVTAFNREGYTYFSVTGVKNGEEGTLFNLVVTPKFIKKLNSGYSSTTVKASCIKNGSLAEGAVIKYAFTDDSEVASAYTAVINVNDFSGETIYFYLFNGETVIDSETCVIVSDGEDATIAARAELDNEMDGVSLGDDNVLDNGATVGSGVKLWTGSSEANITIIEITGNITDTGVTYWAKPSNLADEPGNWSWVSGSTTGASFDFTNNPYTKMDFKITFPEQSNTRGGYVFNENLREVLNVAVIGYGGGNPNVQADASYIIIGVQGGKDGVVYKIVPSRDNVFFDPNTSEYSVTGVTCVAYEGVDIIDNNPDFGIFHSINDVYNSYSGSLTSGSSVAFSELGMSSVTFYLVWNYRFANYIVDRETVPVITQGTNARGSIYLELDNEIDGISIGGDDVLDTQTDVSVGFTFYSGTTGVAMTKLTLVATNDFDTYNCILTCNTGTQYNASFNGDTAEFVIDSSNVTGGTVEITLESGLTFNHTQKFVITLEAEGSDVIGAYRAVYSLFGIKNGVDGVVFKLMPDANSVIYDPNGGVFNPSILRCDAYTGTTAMTKITDFDVYSIRYTINETGATTGDTTGLTSAGVTLNSDDIEKIYFYLFYRIDSDEWVMVDRESIPIIRQGENNFLLDLNNQNASINCDSSGAILDRAYRPSCKATLYLGNTALTTGVVYAITNSSCTYAGISINSSTGQLTFASSATTPGLSFTDSTLILEITAGYGGLSATTKFNLSKNIGGENAVTYWIEPSQNVVHCAADYDGVITSLTCKVYKQVGENPPQVYPPTGSTQPHLYYRYSTGSTAIIYDNDDGIEVESDDSQLIFELKDTSVNPAIIYDSETIPVLKDGAKGDSGATGEAGRVGVTIRRSVWETGKTYYDGTVSSETGEYYLDIVADKAMATTGETVNYAKCISSHTSSNEITSGNTTYWTGVTNTEPLATPLLIADLISADYIDVDSLTVNKLQVKSNIDTGVTILAAGTDPDYPLICGGNGDPLSAVTKISSAGTFTTVAGEIGGWVISEEGLTSTNHEISLQSSGKQIVLKNETSGMTTQINCNYYKYDDLSVGQTLSVGASQGGDDSVRNESYGVSKTLKVYLSSNISIKTPLNLTITNNTVSAVTYFVLQQNTYGGRLEYEYGLENISTFGCIAFDGGTYIANNISEVGDFCNEKVLRSGSIKVNNITPGTYKLYIKAKLDIYSSVGIPDYRGQEIGLSCGWARNNTASIDGENKVNMFFGNGFSTSITSKDNFLVMNRVKQYGAATSATANTSYLRFVTSGINGVEIYAEKFGIKVNSQSVWTTLSAPLDKLPNRLRIGNTTLLNSSTAATQTIISTDMGSKYRYLLYSGSTTAQVYLPNMSSMKDGEFFYIFPAKQLKLYAPYDHNVIYCSGYNTVAADKSANSLIDTFIAKKYFIKVTYLKPSADDDENLCIVQLYR